MKRRQKTEFGQFLVDQIKRSDMSQEEFYNAVPIKKPYFYDLLTATPPPMDLQNRMLDVLDEKTGADEERRKKFYDLAAMGRKEIPADIVRFITEHSNDLDSIRSALSDLVFVPR